MIDNNAYNITQKGDYSYSLVSKGEYSNILYSSILKTGLLNRTNIPAFLDKNTNTILFTAETVQTLSSYLETIKTTTTNPISKINSKTKYNKMSEPECAKLIIHLTTQIKYLEDLNYVLYGYDLNDILVINGDTFIIANSNYILPVENNMFFFYNPNIMPFFSSLELLNLTSLPASIHYKSSYYSLGVLVVFCLLNRQLLETMNDKMIEAILSPVYYSKIYWFIKRCLNKNCEERVLLYI
jgi:hypothetical protein